MKSLCPGVPDPELWNSITTTPSDPQSQLQVPKQTTTPRDAGALLLGSDTNSGLKQTWSKQEQKRNPQRIGKFGKFKTWGSEKEIQVESYVAEKC